MKEAKWNRDLIDEMRYFPFSTYKDQVDAGALAYTVMASPAPVAGAISLERRR